MEVYSPTTPVHSISYAKLAPGCALIGANFDPIQEIGLKVGGGHSFEGGRSFARPRYVYLLFHILQHINKSKVSVEQENKQLTAPKSKTISKEFSFDIKIDSWVLQWTQTEGRGLPSETVVCLWEEVLVSKNSQQQFQTSTQNKVCLHVREWVMQ